MENRLVIFVLIFVGLFSSCTSIQTPLVPTPTPLATSDTVLIPHARVDDIWPTVKWLESTPEEQGMNSESFVEMLDLLNVFDYAIDSIVVVRNGYVVLDVKKYPFGNIPNEKHNIFSCTKSVISVLIGIAIDKGFIKNVYQPVIGFFPEKQIKHLDDSKKGMTLEHLLTMTTGLNCQDSYLYQWAGLNQMEISLDWVQHILDLPMAEEPGTHFEYCNGASFLLSAIIQKTTGVNAFEFANENLFTPLGISHISWSGNRQGEALGYTGLQMLPRDMAKIGYLILTNGIWDGKQIVTSSWIEKSTQRHIYGTLQEGYGYQWWTDDSGIIMGLGYRGQYIIIEPKLDLVVVFASSLGEENFYLPEQLLKNFIVPAVHSTEPLSKNPEAEASLYSLIYDLSTP